MPQHTLIQTNYGDEQSTSNKPVIPIELVTAGI